MTPDYRPYCYLISWIKPEIKSTNNFDWSGLNSGLAPELKGYLIFVSYYGCEVASKTKIANPQNLWKSYFTSSKHVETFRALHGEPDVVEVRCVFKTREQALRCEEKVLKKVDAARSDQWLNRHNGGARPSTVSPMKGKHLSDDACRNIRQAALLRHAKERETNPTGLTEQKVLEIFAATGRNKEIAQRFGVNLSQVSTIKLGLRWSWLTGKTQEKLGPLRGEKNSRTKLTEKEVLEIYYAQGTCREIAQQFGVGVRHVTKIRSGTRWSWLTGAKPKPCLYRTSGHVGVHKLKNNKWKALHHEQYVGTFDTIEDAVAARKAAERKYLENQQLQMAA